ncbi:hypothetical protein [Psychromonas ossibalaenae]|uniref:hypothetical protein n=1 Tax=Psychromonas ossibalaenae TaxID=444922 RepID=UPI00037D39AD|nr:hypothetical protein [Psychromonas ossibalaenae]
MVAAVAKTKVQEAFEIIHSMDYSTLGKISDFSLRRFRKSYQDINDNAIDSYYFCKAFDAAITGDREVLKENIAFTMSSNPSITNILNIIKLCEQMGLYNLAGEIATPINYVGLEVDDAYQVADSLALVGLTDKAEEILRHIKKAYPELSYRFECVAPKIIDEISKRNIRFEDLKSYWDQFELKITNSIIKPKMFERRPMITIHTEVQPVFMNIEFETLNTLMPEEVLWDNSDAIAKGLSEIEAPIELLTFIVSDINYSNQNIKV